jgi:hypothetical protein
MTLLNDTPFVTLFRRDDFLQAFQLLKNGDPVDLSSGSPDIAICFPKEDGSGSFTYRIGSGITLLAASLGKFSLAIPKADSALISPLGRIDLDFVLTQSGKDQTYRFDKALLIADRQC